MLTGRGKTLWASWDLSILPASDNQNTPHKMLKMAVLFVRRLSG